jgi:hypothetical protein
LAFFTETEMLGSARQRFLEQSAPHDDEPSLADGLSAVLDLLKNPKAVEKLASRALDAVNDIARAEKAKLESESAQAKAEDGIAAAKAEIEKLWASHEAAVAKREKLVADTEKQVANSLAQAKLDAKAAADLKAEAQRRLAAVEKAVAGS